MKQKHTFSPESLMMSYAYDPQLSEGAIKCPIFQTSTFAFKTAEEGKAYFELAYGLREVEKGEKVGLIYSRLNNPDLEILENRLCLWDLAEECAVFESGMSAISTALLEFLKPGDLLLYSNPLYGGTIHFIQHFITKLGIHILGFDSAMDKKEIQKMIEMSDHADKLAFILIESPSNPTNTLIDISMCKEIADQYSTTEHQVLLAVDNTYLGPLWQHPLKHGADLVIYSATKYIGGHSDVIAGAVLGDKVLIERIKALRTFFGNMAGPWTGWLLMRSLETLKIRMEQQAKNAKLIAKHLSNHHGVEKVFYLGLLGPKNKRFYPIYKKQCNSPGAMVSFIIKGDEKTAFAFLNSLKLIKLAVSLGSTESLAQHPHSMTHAGMEEEEKNRYGIRHTLIRLSIGVEDIKDLIWDIEQAFNNVAVKGHQSEVVKMQ